MVVARRYAQALYEQAEAASKTEAVDEDMEAVHASLTASGELARFFRSPVISREKKLAVVRELFSGRVDPLTLHFVEMLVRKHREDVFQQIAEAYRALRHEQQGIVEAHARAARDLTESERSDLADALSRITGKTVRLQVSQDENLIGGVVIRVNDTVYDGSVRHQLEQLRERMEVASISLN